MNYKVMFLIETRRGQRYGNSTRNTRQMQDKERGETVHTESFYNRNIVKMIF